MGEKQNGPFQLSFNASRKVDFQGSRVTSDGGLILVRELDERLGLGELIDRRLVDRRQGKNTQFPLADLLRQSVYSRLAGYEDAEVSGCMVEGGQVAILQILAETGYHSCLTTFPIHADTISQSPNRNDSVRGCGFAK